MTADHALSMRQGVCQDFTHIMIALVRQLRDPLPVRQRLPLSSEQRPRSLGRGRDARLG